MSRSRECASSDTTASRLQAVEGRLADIPALPSEGDRVVAVHEVEAELCLLKPEALLYPTWIRLRESLYRFDKDRRAAWIEDVAGFFGANGELTRAEAVLRQRLQQLTLELQESAMRYNRLAEERADVTREVSKLGSWMIIVLLVLLVSCLTFANADVPDWASTLMSLASAFLAGGMGSIFSRLRTLRSERVRHEFSGTFKWDLWTRACLGAGAALVTVSVLLSGILPIAVPEEVGARLPFFVGFGFAAGLSETPHIAGSARAANAFASRNAGVICRGLRANEAKRACFSSREKHLMSP
ncbi:MAG: hypothetical protein OXH09_04840 [Gammaproteobacteria bacterium]|nr:hypothetical protein [Gammaproteobacteria bacterium]